MTGETLLLADNVTGGANTRLLTVAALKKACAEEGFDYRKLVDDLVADGFFVPSDTVEKGYKKPRPTVKVWLAKSATNCYRFRAEHFKR